MDSLLSDEDIKDKGNKEMYLNVFDGKRNRATVQRGYSLIQLLVVMLLVSILATVAFTAYRESVRSANLRAAHAALLENARFMEQFYTKKGSFKLTSTCLLWIIVIKRLQKAIPVFYPAFVFYR